MLVESGVGGKVGYVSNVVVSQSFKLAECECFNVSRKSWCGKTFSSSFVVRVEWPFHLNISRSEMQGSKGIRQWLIK